MPEPDLIQQQRDIARAIQTAFRENARTSASLDSALSRDLAMAEQQRASNREEVDDFHDRFITLHRFVVLRIESWDRKAFNKARVKLSTSASAVNSPQTLKDCTVQMRTLVEWYVPTDSNLQDELAKMAAKQQKGFSTWQSVIIIAVVTGVLYLAGGLMPIFGIGLIVLFLYAYGLSKRPKVVRDAA